MGVRRNASWQERLDERILELLNDEPWSIPEIMKLEIPIDATENQIRDRCMVLADAELVHIDLDDGFKVEIRGLGQRYLRGEADVDLYPPPRSIKHIEEEVFGSRS